MGKSPQRPLGRHWGRHLPCTCSLSTCSAQDKGATLASFSPSEAGPGSPLTPAITEGTTLGPVTSASHAVDPSHEIEETGRDNVVTTTEKSNGRKRRKPVNGETWLTGVGTPQTVAEPWGLWTWMTPEGASNGRPVATQKG